MKIKILLASAVVLPSIVYSTEPTIRVSDGQTLTIIGTVDRSGSTVTLKPDEFVVYKDNQSFQTIFKLSAASDAARESLEQFNRNWKAEADCTVQISKFGEVVCSLSEIRQHAEHEVETSAQIKARQARDEAAAKTLSPTTIGQTALTITDQREPGTVIPRAKLFSVLYPNLRCDLPIESARTMRKAEILYGNQLANSCWGMAISPLKDQFVSVTKYGNTDSGSIVGYTKVKILGDGSARVIGPAVSASEYQKRVDDYQRATR